MGIRGIVQLGRGLPARGDRAPMKLAGVSFYSYEMGLTHFGPCLMFTPKAINVPRGLEARAPM